jgi:hypothetical protein
MNHGNILYYQCMFHKNDVVIANIHWNLFVLSKVLGESEKTHNSFNKHYLL